jgi:hypothetical protein
MAHALFHAQSSVRKYGESVGDYQAIHDWQPRSQAGGESCGACICQLRKSVETSNGDDMYSTSAICLDITVAAALF